MKRAIESLSESLSRMVKEDWAETMSKLLILSNSNSMFIELVLKHHSLWSLFDGAVITIWHDQCYHQCAMDPTTKTSNLLCCVVYKTGVGNDSV
ncbi:hypothetical protein PGT21_002179 [Puccinia graminis f. sp. tritici]|uniref:Uncharacterized protein n=1 Tax=Puccinia graminis f. sp. tritici TaxID=56615 RepID=A0A5B0P383_PUCGR|nr:hypothetical protein PGT21_002179 [Puccinia graminis f. sp. tritici]KAA1137191.1 hypothetical protein PGTUg99_013139 [Puccinia graminis f. sp. tritici]